MPIYYKKKFVLTLKESSQSDPFIEITDIVKKWLLKQCPDIVKESILPIWSDVIHGAQIGDESYKSDLCLESKLIEDSRTHSPSHWACKITEPIRSEKSALGVILQRWVSEIGYHRVSETSIDIYFVVSYLNSKKTYSIADSKIPGIAKSIIASGNWICTVQEMSENEMLGVETCTEMETNITNAKISGDYSIDKRWISLCKVNRPDKNDHIWMIRIADANAGELIVPSFDEKNEQIFDNRRFIFHTDGPTEPDILGFWEWNEYQTDSGAWYSETSFIEDTTPIELVILESFTDVREIVSVLKYSLQGTTQGRYLTGGVPPVRFSM